jgi:hypothetical protein
MRIFTLKLSVIMQNVTFLLFCCVALIIVMLSVVTLSVVILSHVAWLIGMSE